jgi:hypothetical protein
LAVATPHCPVAKLGVELLQTLCTEFEVSYSAAPLLPYRDLVRRLPGYYLRFKEYMAQFGLDMRRGNYFDMHDRRNRAYEMARRHAEINNFEWDLIAFVRLDSAFYSPKVDFFKIHTALTEFNSTGQRGIWIPPACNFHGVCDRLAIGLPQNMELYFRKDFVFDVLEWSLDEGEVKSILYYPKMGVRTNGNSEHMLESWFLMNNISQVFFPQEQMPTFVTVRTAQASAYCSLTRRQYVLEYPLPTFVFDPDKTTANPDLTNKPIGFDLVSSAEQRCGLKAGRMNSTLMCLHHPGCKCGTYGRRR